MGFKIGNFDFSHGLVLAPMAGVTDRTFRNICKSYGAEYTVSEMVCAKSLCYEQKARKKEFSTTAELATVLSGDGPMAIQIFGSEPSFMAEAAVMLTEGSYKNCISTEKPIAIDINMGCPVRKITSNGEGSALMRNTRLAGEIVRAVSDAVSIPVTVKIRAGWDDSSKNAVELAKILEANGAASICVHARTKEQLYRPGIDVDIITKVKKAVSVPVIGNGDINSAEDAVSMINDTGVDGIAIGRGAVGNPFIFREIRAAILGESYCAPSLRDRVEAALYQLRTAIEDKGERVAVCEARKQIALYLKGFRGAASIRGEINRALTYKEVEAILRTSCSTD